MSAARWAAEQGVTVRLRVRFEQNQTTLIDPFEITKLEILDPDDNVIETITSGWVKESTGIWYYDWAIPSGASVGIWKDRWTWVPYDGYDSRADTLYFNVFAAGAISAADGYITTAQARTFLDAGSTLTDAEVDSLVQLASRFFERACGRYFTPQTVTVDADGSGDAYQHIPGTENIRSITSLTDRRTDTELDASVMVFRGSTIYHQNYVPWPRATEIEPHLRCATGEIFPRGTLNIRFVGQRGDFASVPELVQHGVGLIVKAAGADDATDSSWIANYTNESVDGLSVTYRDMDPGSRLKGSTGIPEIDAIVNQFKKRKGRVASLGAR